MLKSSRCWHLPKFALASSIVILWTLPVPNHSQSTDNKPLLYESELDRVLNPQALKSTSSPESTEQLRTRFANPPVDYRSILKPPMRLIESKSANFLETLSNGLLMMSHCLPGVFMTSPL